MSKTPSNYGAVTRPPRFHGAQLDKDSDARLMALEAHRGRLYAAMIEATDLPLSREELEIHFASMPLRYWLRVDAVTLRWHLEMIQQFFAGLGDLDAAVTVPVVRWYHLPDRGITEVAVCTWDRQGLLAKVAGAFAMVGLNIVRADVYTRADDVVVDVFQVCTPDNRHVADESSLDTMIDLLTAALSTEADQAGMIARQTAKVFDGTRLTGTPAPVVTFDNNRSDDYTVLYVEASDRLGLLYAILQVLSDAQTDIAHAIITTDKGMAADVFYLATTDGRKIEDNFRLDEIRRGLMAALA